MAGEVHPRARNRAAWARRVEEICDLVLDFGLLPHTNVGPLSRVEMERLKARNASMGLMLEQTSPSLLGPGGVHRLAPKVRLEQLRQAGELHIPFTTGLLVGIGEAPSERLEALEAIARVASDFGHVQEVILQPHSLGSMQRLRPLGGEGEDFATAESKRRGGGVRRQHAPPVGTLFGEEAASALPGLVRSARAMLPPGVAIQVPPNLVVEGGRTAYGGGGSDGTATWVAGGRGWDLLLECLQGGATDLGGISPKDEVNPDYGFPSISALEEALAVEGYSLERRLPVYPEYFGWLSERVQSVLRRHLHATDACDIRHPHFQGNSCGELRRVADQPSGHPI